MITVPTLFLKLCYTIFIILNQSDASFQKDFNGSYLPPLSKANLSFDSPFGLRSG